jgi:hypothetical protein
MINASSLGIPPTVAPTTAPTGTAQGGQSSATLAGVSVSWSLLPGGKEVNISASIAGSVWLAIGLGTKMVNGRVVIGRKDANVTENAMSGYSESGIGPFLSRSISNAVFQQVNGQTTLSFTAASIAGQPINLRATDSVIVAYGSSNTFARHTKEGVGIVNWALGSAEEAGSAATGLLWAHGALMTLAWAFLLPFGISVSIFGRHKKGGWWFKYHQICQYSGVMLMLVAYFCMCARIDLPCWLKPRALPHVQAVSLSKVACST